MEKKKYTIPFSILDISYMENPFLDSAPVLQILLKISYALRKPPSLQTLVFLPSPVTGKHFMSDKKQEAEVSLNTILNPRTAGNCSYTIAKLCYCPGLQQLNFPYPTVVHHCLSSLQEHPCKVIQTAQT